MIIFDSDPLFAYVNAQHPKHSVACSIMSEALKGVYGKLVVPNYIIDEVLTLSRVRTKRCDYGEAILNLLRATKENKRIFLEIILNQEMLLLTETLYKRYCPKGLSFTDCSLIALMQIFGINHLATFASEFQGLVSIIPL